MMRLLGFFRGLLFTTWPCHQGNQALREIKIWHNLFRNGGHKLHWGQQYSLKRNFWTPGHPDCLEEGLYFRGRGPRLTSSWTAWSERWKPWPWWRRCRCRALPARGPSPLCFRCPVRGAHILNSKSLYSFAFEIIFIINRNFDIIPICLADPVELDGLHSAGDEEGGADHHESKLLEMGIVCDFHREVPDRQTSTGRRSTLSPIFCCNKFGEFPRLVGRYCS